MFTHIPLKTNTRIAIRRLLAAAFALLTFSCSARQAFAQAQLADDIVLLSQGLRSQESSRTNSHLGNAPGGGDNRLRFRPGTDEPRLGETLGSSPAQGPDVLAAASRPGMQARTSGGAELLATPTPQARPAELPIYGSLELPQAVDDGPPDGLTLDQAVARLVQTNLDLRTKFQEIPKADADILSAGLRGNPLVFASADDVPYGKYSPQRPGENAYGVTIIQPLDINHKRPVRVLAAQRAKRVIDAQYQEAVRLELDNLYTTFIDVLAARETVRYLEASVAGLNKVLAALQRQLQNEQRASLDIDRMAIQHDTAQVALEEAQIAFRKAIHLLATQLNMPAAFAENVQIRGSIRTTPVALAPVDDLVGLAQAGRPDLMAYRLGIDHAEAGVGLARKEAYPDVFVLYTPYGYRNNTPTGGLDATSWSLGVMASVPLFNRNQGNIRRAEINTAQTRVELAKLQRQIELEVRTAVAEYRLAESTAQRLEQNVLPRAQGVRDRTLRLLQSGEEGVVAYLAAQREYSDIVRQFRDTLIRQRRAALHVNTVLALRVFP